MLTAYLEMTDAVPAARIARDCRTLPGTLAAPAGLARILSVLAPVRPGEGPTALLLSACVIALGTYGAIGAAGGLALVRAAKIAENATDYSLQDTVRQALFLPAERAVKYKAKAAIDTFFLRLGDTLSALCVGASIHQLGLAPRQLALGTIALIGLWLAIAAAIARRHRAIEGRASAGPAITEAAPAPALRAGARA